MSLVARDVRFSYAPGSPVLDGVSLAVGAGERVAVNAPSGRGKTTLCRLLAGYLRPEAGTIEVDGRPLEPARSRGPLPVQLIYQHPEQAFDPYRRMARSLAEVGAPGADALGNADLLERFGVRASWLDRLPHELSGGELMRLAVVRALITRPRYLICDEMTAMLDMVSQAELWRGVVEIAEEREMGIVLVSHSEPLVRRVATRTVELQALR